MKSYPILVPYQTDKELANIEILITSGRLREREALAEVIEQFCSCEIRKLHACTCEIYVKDLLKALKAENK